MQQTVVKFIALLYRYCSTCFGHHNAHHHFVNKPTTAENTSTCTFIRKPEAATAVWRAPDDGHCDARNMLSSIFTRQQILRLFAASSWLFYSSDWRCMEPQTLNSLVYSSPLCCKYIILDWVTVKTQLLYCSISYLFIAFIGFIASVAVLAQTTCFGPSLGPSSGLACV
jgi:hypothetical protein